MSKVPFSSVLMDNVQKDAGPFKFIYWMHPRVKLFIKDTEMKLCI